MIQPLLPNRQYLLDQVCQYSKHYGPDMNIPKTKFMIYDMKMRPRM